MRLYQDVSYSTRWHYNAETRLITSIYGQIHTFLLNSAVFTIVRRARTQIQSDQASWKGNYKRMKRSRLIFTLLTLAFVISVATIVGLMVTAVQIAAEKTTTSLKPTTTVTTFSTTDATTTTSYTSSPTTTTSLATTTTNLDEWLCDNWVCDWKGRYLNVNSSSNSATKS